MARQPLTDQQKAFCEHYIQTLNATASAIAAGYSKRSATAQGSSLLRRDHINNYISKRQNVLQTKLKIETRKVLEEFASIAFADISSYVDDKGTLKPYKDIPDTRAIHSVTTSSIKNAAGKTVTKTTIKLHDKQRALENLGKHLGIYSRDNVLDITSNGMALNKQLTDADLISAIRAAAEQHPSE